MSDAMARIRAALRRDTEGEGLPGWLGEALFVFPFIGGLLVIAARADKPFFRLLTREDGILEWIQFGGYVAAAVFALLVARRLVGKRRFGFAALFLCVSAAAVFVGGEEIAWGQRVLGLETPEPLKAVNTQKEITVHNIGRTQDVFNALFFTASLYAVFAPMIWYRLGKPARDRLSLLIPPLTAVGFFAVVAAYKITRYTVFPKSGFSVTRVGEWAEVCFALGLAGFTGLLARRLSARRMRLLAQQDSIGAALQPGGSAAEREQAA